jgi:glycosyltransferase involved in cell wall biosynthesis
MLIAHVLTRLLRAGSEENTLATCLAQARAGHRVMLIHGNQWNPIYRDTYGAEIELIEIPEMAHPIAPMKDLKAISRLRKLFSERRPDVVHTHQSKAGVLGRAAARLAGVPVIIHGVHILSFVDVSFMKRVIFLAAEKAVARFTDGYISVSDGMRQTCLEHRLGKTADHFVARSGMDLARFEQAQLPAQWRQMLGISETERKPPIVLMLAVLEPRKRHVEFLRVFRQVVDQVPDVRLLLAGEGAVRAAIEAEILRLGLQHRVTLLGFQSKPEQWLALADLTVLTSMREGLPRVVVQSLASGKPLVVSHLPGIEEIVKDKVNGLVTPADDLHAAGRAIVNLLQHPEQLEAMQREAARTDIGAWNIETMCQTIAEIYEQLIARKVRLNGGADIVSP